MLKVTAVFGTVPEFFSPNRKGRPPLLPRHGGSLLLLLCCSGGEIRLHTLELRGAEPEGNFLDFSNWSLSTPKPLLRVGRKTQKQMWQWKRSQSLPVQNHPWWVNILMFCFLSGLFFSFQEVVLCSFPRGHVRWRAEKPYPSSGERGGALCLRVVPWASDLTALQLQSQAWCIWGMFSQPSGCKLSYLPPAASSPPGISLVLLVLWPDCLHHQAPRPGQIPLWPPLQDFFTCVLVSFCGQASQFLILSSLHHSSLTGPGERSRFSVCCGGRGKNWEFMVDIAKNNPHPLSQWVRIPGSGIVCPWERGWGCLPLALCPPSLWRMLASMTFLSSWQ